MKEPLGGSFSGHPALDLCSGLGLWVVSSGPAWSLLKKNFFKLK